MIESLPQLIPDPARASNVRALCHDRLERQRRRAERKAAGSTVERAVAASFAAVYLIAVTVNALSVFVKF